MLMRLIYTPCTHILTFTTICMGCPAHPRGVASAGFSHSNHEKLQLYNNLNLKFFKFKYLHDSNFDNFCDRDSQARSRAWLQWLGGHPARDCLVT